MAVNRTTDIIKVFTAATRTVVRVYECDAMFLREIT